MRPLFHSAILGSLLLLAVPAVVCQQTDEYQVKAGFVARFASFVDWSPEALGGAGVPFGICVLGRNPFGKALETFVDGKNVAGHGIQIRQLSDVRMAAGCEILFVSGSERLRFRFILDAVPVGVFTVGDAPDFIAQGGVANLWIDQGKVRVEINADAAKARNLKVSSRLMMLAKPQPAGQRE